MVTGREALVPNGTGRQPTEQIDISVTHWAAQYVPESRRGRASAARTGTPIRR